MFLHSVLQFFSDHATAIQVAFYAAILGGFWIFEWRQTGRHTLRKLGHTGFNATFMLLALPVQLAMMSLVLALSHWCTTSHVGLLYLLPFHDTAIVKYGVMFLVMDFLDYAYHYAAHQIPWLWRLHLVHHSDRDMDVSTTFREHPAETFVRTAVLALWVFLCGAPLELLVLRQTFETIANVGQHSRLGLPKRVAAFAQYIFVTPDMHQAHHHARLPGTDCNYGDVLSFWDRLFGTRLHLSRDRIQFGVDTHLDQHNDMAALLGISRSLRGRRETSVRRAPSPAIVSKAYATDMRKG